MIEDKELLWKPFGLTLTYKEYRDLISWYIQKKISDNLNKKEEDKNNAFKLYSEDLTSRTY